MISDLFTRAIQTGAGGVPGGFIVREEDGHSRLAIRNEVTHKLIPPSKEGDSYRGVITVTSQRNYSIQRSARNDSSGDKSGDQNGNNRRVISQDDDGVNVYDGDLVKAPAKERSTDSGQSDEMIARLSDEDVRDYQLVYENNQWVLKTALDPETEQSIESAFNHALSLQP